MNYDGLIGGIKEIYAKSGIEFRATVTEEDKILLVFLAGYRPFDYPSDCYRIDSYYEISNKTYRAEKEIIKLLRKNGISADFYRGKNLRSVAERARLGKRAFSGFLYCDAYGTYCFIGCAEITGLTFDEELSNALRTLDRTPEITRSCDGCRACQAACPTKAVPDKKEFCLRNVQENARKGLSEELKLCAEKLGDRLLGCGACQEFCPLNIGIKSRPLPENLYNLLKKENFRKAIENNDLKELKEIIGTNYGRKSVLAPVLGLIENNDEPKEHNESATDGENEK